MENLSEQQQQTQNSMSSPGNQQQYLQQQQQQFPQQAAMVPPGLMPQFDTDVQIHQLIAQFWATQMAQIQTQEFDFKSGHQLPLARIKKVMKTDDDIRTKMMISGEVPVVLAKACEIFVLEVTMRAWIHTEENKRRTLQKSDLVAAFSKSDMFDFLIDIVPRDMSRKPEGAVMDMQNYYASGMMAFANQPDPSILYQQQLAQMSYMRFMQSHAVEGQLPVSNDDLSELPSKDQQQQS